MDYVTAVGNIRGQARFEENEARKQANRKQRETEGLFYRVEFNNFITDGMTHNQATKQAVDSTYKNYQRWFNCWDKYAGMRASLVYGGYYYPMIYETMPELSIEKLYTYILECYPEFDDVHRVINSRLFKVTTYGSFRVAENWLREHSKTKALNDLEEAYNKAKLVK